MELSKLLQFDPMLLTQCASTPQLTITRIASHTKEAIPGSLFICAEQSFKATEYIKQAYQAGAVAVIAYPGIAPIDGLVWIQADNPRRALAQIAAQWFPKQPDVVAAATGTNGKTSVTAFLRHIWAQQGFKAASLGTIGIQPNHLADILGTELQEQLSLTTPSPLAVHACLDKLEEHGITHVAMEASSHGLEQERLAGVRLAVAGFTNLTQDHLDYHGTMDHYFEAKARLFLELLPAHQPAVINIDDPYGQELAKRCQQRGLQIIDYSIRNKPAALTAEYKPSQSTFMLRVKAENYTVNLPILGAFQVANALCAVGMAIATGVAVPAALKALETLQGAPGRLELIGITKAGGRVFVDYAHTPDALENVLRTAREFTSGKLWVLFGAGGDRDRGKRPLMGKVAAELADHVIVTDDNPRSENPASIRTAILAACPDAMEIGNRAEAIAVGIVKLQQGDTLIVAGKGHETGQIVGDVVYPFSDRSVVREILGKNDAVEL